MELSTMNEFIPKNKYIEPTAEHKENMIIEHLTTDNLYQKSLNAIISTLLSDRTVSFPISYTENAGWTIYKSGSYIEKLTGLTGDNAISTYVANYKFTVANKEFVEEFLIFHSDEVISKIIAKLDNGQIQKIIDAIATHITGQFNIICRINGHRFLLKYSGRHKNLVKLMNGSVSDYIKLLSVDNLKKNYDQTTPIEKGRNKYSLSTVIDKYLSVCG